MKNTIEKQYYTAKDLQIMLDCCRTTAYNVINEYNGHLKEKYPHIQVLPTRLPIWFWEECMIPKKEGSEQYVKEN